MVKKCLGMVNGEAFRGGGRLEEWREEGAAHDTSQRLVVALPL